MENLKRRLAALPPAEQRRIIAALDLRVGQDAASRCVGEAPAGYAASASLQRIHADLDGMSDENCRGLRDWLFANQHQETPEFLASLDAASAEFHAGNHVIFSRAGLAEQIRQWAGASS